MVCVRAKAGAGRDQPEGAGGLDIISIEVSDDGGASYILLDEIGVVGTVNGSKAYNLAGLVSLDNEIQLRLQIKQGFAGPGQYISFDHIKLEVDDYDPFGHGSHVAGIIGGSGTESGIAPNAVEATDVRALTVGQR